MRDSRPADAVLYAGDKSFVFVDLGDFRLAPRRVRVALRYRYAHW